MMSDNSQREIRFPGLDSARTFVREPGGNRCIERLFRTLRERLLWVRQFDTLEELAEAPQNFRQRYNKPWLTDWLMERRRFHSPRQAHQALVIRSPAA